MPDLIDEFLTKRKDFVKSGNVLMKATREPASWNDATRSARFVMSSQEEDRDKDIIHQDGLSVDGFMKNPVALLFHSSRSFPLGQWTDIEKNLMGRPKRTEGTIKFVDEGGDVDADRAAFHVKQGTLRACSIGFIPKTLERRTPKDENDYYPGYEIREAEMIECSIVTVPANPSALAKDWQGLEEFKMARDLIEDVLDNWVKHPETGLLVPRAEFEAAHKDLTGNKTSIVLSEAAEKSLLTKFTDSVKSLFVLKQPEPTAPVVATAEAKAAVAARLAAYRERASLQP